jgi:hypothetical protein
MLLVFKFFPAIADILLVDAHTPLGKTGQEPRHDTVQERRQECDAA